MEFIDIEVSGNPSVHREDAVKGRLIADEANTE